MTKSKHLDMVDVEAFLNHYDYWGSDGWVQEILNDNIDLELMREAVIKLSQGKEAECQSLVDDMFIEKWWDKEEA